jgi:hypothetical protein
MLAMTDWKLAAQAWCPDIPGAEVDRIAPVLEALEAELAPLAAGIAINAEPAPVFSAEEPQEEP